MLHEYVHVRQKHSIDLFAAELLCILCWYNPFAWLMRLAIRQNLEFIADRAVLQQGLDKKTYQRHLLKSMGVPGYRIASNFNFSSLKKRITMMNTLRSAKVHLLKFLFVLPLAGVLLLAFRSVHYKRNVRNQHPVQMPGQAKQPEPGSPATTAAYKRQPASFRFLPTDTLPDQRRPEKNKVAVGASYEGDSTPVTVLTHFDREVRITGLANKLVIVDGVEIPQGVYSENLLPEEEIKSINILTDKSAIDAYALKGKNGVVEIHTKKGDFSLTAATAKHAMTLALFIVDGKEVADISNLDPRTIYTMNVYKDTAATRLYGERGRNGVIVIVTGKPVNTDSLPFKKKSLQ